MKINSISNVFFSHKIKEHKSWGAVVDKDSKDVSFKIFTYPDTKEAYVTVEKDDGEIIIPLQNKGEGVFERKNVSHQFVQDGDKYYYTLVDKKGNESGPLKDPYSFRQDEFMGKSVVYNQNAYVWKDFDWFLNNKSRVSRIANVKNGLSPVSSLRIYELNIATLTKKGDFRSAKEALTRIKSLGFNAIEIMPVENTFSFNWGYDGVDKFAPSTTLGSPDDLKELINCAHNLGLNVIMDIVPNHLGPDGAELHRFGPYIKGPNDFGSAFNFEGENSKYVRDYIVNTAINWLDNYHCDGLRLDMTKYMNSDFTMKQIAQEVNYHKPDAFLIAEDARGGNDTDGNNIFPSYNTHDERVTYPLKDFEINFKTEDDHAKKIESMTIEDTNYSRLGYDSEWDFPYYHTLETIRNFDFDSGDEQSKMRMIDDFASALISSQKRVKYVMSHDEIGNNSGTRLIAKLLTNRLNLADKVKLSASDNVRKLKLMEKGCSEEDAINRIRYQKADLIGEKLAIGMQKGRFDNYKEETFEKNILSKYGLDASDEINLENIRKVYKESYDKTKVLYASMYAIPGTKMVFQGDESATLTPFRFFRQFQDESDNKNLTLEKGYKSGTSALNASKLDNRKVKNKYSHSFEILTHNLNYLNIASPCLSKGYIVNNSIIKHPSSGVISYLIRDDETLDEMYVILNFSNKNYSMRNNNQYQIPFPKGAWSEVLNTDAKVYFGEGNINIEKITSDGNNQEINLGRNSCIIFKKQK